MTALYCASKPVIDQDGFDRPFSLSHAVRSESAFIVLTYPRIFAGSQPELCPEGSVRLHSHQVERYDLQDHFSSWARAQLPLARLASLSGKKKALNRILRS